LKFLKWLVYPDLTPQERKRLPRDQLPSVLKTFSPKKKDQRVLLRLKIIGMIKMSPSF